MKVRSLSKKCLHCGKLLPVSALNKALSLWCNPTEHFMCSVECLQRHALVCTNYSLMDLNYVTCPLCWTSVPPEQIREAFGDRFEQIQADACDRALKNLLNQEEHKKLDARFKCEICFNEFVVSDGITLECDHRFCMECMEMYTKNLIQAAQVNEASLKCPNCTQPLTLYEIEDIVGPELYEKYQKFLLRGFKLSDEDNPNSFIFNCPGADCEFFCIIEKDLEEIECPKCFVVSCPKCKAEAHKGMSCEEAKKNKEMNGKGDELFEKMLDAEGMIRCPACGAAVQRISGCEFMVCTSSQCQGRTYFCFECGIRLPADHAPHDCEKRHFAVAPRPVMMPGRPPRRRGIKRIVPAIRQAVAGIRRKGK
jgi:hypothetical protein